METEGTLARGVVKFWLPEKGWGAISCPELPSGRDAWVHFSVIAVPPGTYASLTAGQEVEFRYEEVKQDSFDFRATWARPLD